MKNIVTLIILGLLMATISINVYASGIDDFYGTWKVDFDQTLEAIKNNPQYSQEEIDKMPKVIERMMNLMRVKITDSEIIYLRGEKEVIYPYIVIKESGKSARIECSVKGKKFYIDFTLLDNKYMNFQSSGSDDLDFYIWTLSSR